MNNKNRLIFIEKNNFPIELITGRPVTNFIRRLIHTRKIMRYKTWIKKGGCEINFN